MSKHLFVYQPVVVASGQVGGTWNGVYPTLEVPITGVTVFGGTTGTALGDFLQMVQPGHTVIFGTAAGLDDLGRQRIRRTFDNTSLLIGLSPRGIHDGEIDVVVGSYFTIWDDFRIWSKVQNFVKQGVSPFITLYKDADFVFATEGGGTLFKPKANAGPARAGLIDPITSLMTVTLPGPAGFPSYGVPGGVNIATYDWKVKDGTITVGTSASASITVTFPAGFRWISLRVVDINGLEHTMRVPILADNPNSSITVPVWQEESLESEQSGQRFSFRILSSLPRTTYPDGTLVMYFDDANVNHHCDFWGWHHSDDAGVDFVKTGALRDTVLQSLDVGGKLNAIPGQPITITGKDVPANWSEIFHPTMYLFIDHILKWHSTGSDLSDFSDPTLERDYQFISRETQVGSIWGQIQEQARAITPDHVITCNRLGQLLFRPDPLHEHPSFRVTTVQATLTGYISGISMEHTRPPKIHWIRAGAVIEGWTPTGTTIQVEYTIRPSAETPAGATTIPVLALPVQIPSGALLDYKGLGIYFIQTTALALVGATSISVVATTQILFEWDHMIYTATEAGPSFVPTQFCIAPGVVHGQGIGDITINNKITQADATLRVTIANSYERVNSEYGLIDIDLAGANDLGIDPALMSWIRPGTLDTKYIPQRLLPIFSTNPRLLPLSLNRRFRHTKEGTVVSISIRAELETGTTLLADIIDGSEF